MFRIASPTVWEHVNGVHNLLDLFPEISVHKSAFSRYFSITTDSTSLHTDRFNLYAPYVKSLEIYGNATNEYEIAGWSSLFALSRQRTLLPNLASLTMATNSWGSFWHIILWVRLFASESLTTVLSAPTSHGTVPEISYLASSIALKWVVEHCPRIQNISLFPSASGEFETLDGEDILLHQLYDKPYYHYLLPTSGIREVSCNLPVLEGEGLKALSGLPMLERLTVYSNDDTPNLEEVELSEHPFSSLKFLHLCLPDLEDVNRILRNHALLANLTTFKVDIQYLFVSHEAPWATGSFFPALAHSPLLEHLAVDFHARAPNSDNDDKLELGNISVLGILGQLPLRTVSISPIGFSYNKLSTNLMSLWPRITYLDLRGTYIPYTDLPMFSQLPTLEHLVLRLRIVGDFSEEPIPSPNMGLCLHTLEGGRKSDLRFEQEHIFQIVNFLVSFWPNLRQVVWPQDVEPHRGLIRLLNKELEVLGELIGLVNGEQEE